MTAESQNRAGMPDPEPHIFLLLQNVLAFLKYLC